MTPGSNGERFHRTGSQGPDCGEVRNGRSTLLQDTGPGNTNIGQTWPRRLPNG